MKHEKKNILGFEVMFIGNKCELTGEQLDKIVKLVFNNTIEQIIQDADLRNDKRIIYTTQKLRLKKFKL
jgi:hypothetical protein